MLGTGFSPWGHLPESCPRLRRLLLPSRSQPCTSELLEAGSLSYPLTWLLLFLFPNSASETGNVLLPPPGAGIGASLSRRAEAVSLLTCSTVSPSACEGRGPAGSCLSGCPCAGSSRFRSGFSRPCGLNRNLQAGRAPCLTKPWANHLQQNAKARKCVFNLYK